MKISQLIKDLQDLMALRGDLPVTIPSVDKVRYVIGVGMSHGRAVGDSYEITAGLYAGEARPTCHLSWLPIETAPKETEVLIGAWIDGAFKWGRSECFYDSGNELEGEPVGGWVWSIDDCSDSVAENPTHWMPRPDAPPR